MAPLSSSATSFPSTSLTSQPLVPVWSRSVQFSVANKGKYRIGGRYSRWLCSNFGIGMKSEVRAEEVQQQECLQQCDRQMSSVMLPAIPKLVDERSPQSRFPLRVWLDICQFVIRRLKMSSTFCRKVDYLRGVVIEKGRNLNVMVTRPLCRRRRLQETHLS